MADRILITGATGFVGSALTARLLSAGHAVTALVRNEGKARAQLGDDVELIGMESLASAVPRADAVINLAGAGLMDARWTEARRRELRDSRIALTEQLVAAMAGEGGPRVLLSASAVGYYGDGGESELREGDARGEGFAAELCGDWEDAALGAQKHGVRVACFRIGIVLDRSGGALEKLSRIFGTGFGGRLGNGKQYMPWIHRADLVELFCTALTDERYEGAINACAPASVRNSEFTRALGQAMHRPTLAPVPAFALKIALGESASTLLGSQRVVAARLGELDFPFRYPDIDGALSAALAHGEVSAGD